MGEDQKPDTRPDMHQDAPEANSWMPRTIPGIRSGSMKRARRPSLPDRRRGNARPASVAPITQSSAVVVAMPMLSQSGRPSACRQTERHTTAMSATWRSAEGICADGKGSEEDDGEIDHPGPRGARCGRYPACKTDNCSLAAGFPVRKSACEGRLRAHCATFSFLKTRMPIAAAALTPSARPRTSVANAAAPRNSGS